MNYSAYEQQSWNGGNWKEAANLGKLLCGRCFCCRFLASAELGGELEQRLVRAARGGQLHAAKGAGDGDRRQAGEAEGRGVAQEARTRFAVVRARGEARYRGAGEQE